MPTSPPPGYVRVQAIDVDAVAMAPLAGPIATALAHGTLYEYAASQSDRRDLVGRGPVYAISLGGVRVVVRRTRRGGLFAPLTGDVFLGSTRAPYELAVSTRLRAGGVATPAVMAYAVYHAGPLLRRADVVTEEVQDAADLLSVLGPAPGPLTHGGAWDAVLDLVDALGRLGAVHADLNVKNVLIVGASGPHPTAYALDVDRVVWRRPGDPAVVRSNLERLRHSARKRGLL